MGRMNRRHRIMYMGSPLLDESLGTWLPIPFHIENNSVSLPRPGPILVPVPKFLGEPPLSAVADVFKMKSFSIPESRVRPVVKSLGALASRSAAALLQECNRQEIQRAITNAKRTAWDKWFRRQWYRAAARRRFAFFQANRHLSGEQRRRYETSKMAARKPDRLRQRARVLRGFRRKRIQMCR